MVSLTDRLKKLLRKGRTEPGSSTEPNAQETEPINFTPLPLFTPLPELFTPDPRRLPSFKPEPTQTLAPPPFTPLPSFTPLPPEDLVKIQQRASFKAQQDQQKAVERAEQIERFETEKAFERRITFGAEEKPRAIGKVRKLDIKKPKFIPIAFGAEGKPRATGRIGRPSDLEIIQDIETIDPAILNLEPSRSVLSTEPAGAVSSALGGGFLVNELGVQNVALKRVRPVFSNQEGGFGVIVGDDKLVKAPKENKLRQPIKFLQNIEDSLSRGTSLSSDPLIGIGGIGFGKREVGKVKAGVVRAFVPTTPLEIGINLATFGAGAGIGGGVKLIGIGTKKVATKIGGRVGEVLPDVTKLGLASVGILAGGLFAKVTALELAEAPTLDLKAEVFGETLKDITLLGAGFKKGERLVSKAIGKFRTRGLTELPPEAVIAPEFFKGDIFPSVRRGQTAGELRAEFFEPILPGERRGVARGFSASPIEVEPKIPPGQFRLGEIAGLFQAPRASPFFFRISKRQERRGFTLDLEGTELPTLLRTTLPSLEFVPGVTAKSKIKPLTFDPTEFSLSQIGTGKTFIPFQKAEKEAITIFDSLVKESGREFFIKFGGERIPIAQVEILGTGKKVPGKKVTPKLTRDVTLGELVSSSRVRPGGVVTPSKIGSLGVGKLPDIFFETERVDLFDPGGREREVSRRPQVSQISRIESDISRGTDLVSEPSRVTGRRPRRVTPRRELPITEILLEPTRRATRRTRRRIPSITEPSRRPFPRRRSDALELFAEIPIGRIGRDRGKRPVIKKKKKLEDVLVFTPDFTSKILGLKKRTTLKQLERETLRGTGLELREIPVFKKKRKKR